MAEIGLVAAVIQIDDTGLKLSTTLYSFAETVSTADRSITHIAKDVSLTAAVLNELSVNLEQDTQSGVASGSALATAEEVVLECKKIFEDINTRLGEGIKKVNSNKYDMARPVRDRWRWPFLQPKVELLRSNLERLKSTLILKLHVLTYAMQIKQ